MKMRWFAYLTALRNQGYHNMDKSRLFYHSARASSTQLLASGFLTQLGLKTNSLKYAHWCCYIEPLFHRLLESNASDLDNSKVTLAQFRDCQMTCIFSLADFFALRQHDKTIGDDQLQQDVDNVMDSAPGPLFTCNMLSGTSCDDPCDWHSGFGKNERSIAIWILEPRDSSRLSCVARTN